MSTLLRNVILAIAVAGAAIAQHNHSAPPAEKPVALLPGLGTWKHPIHTRSAEAQKFFDQGLILMYGFNRPEALRSFRKTVELDPHASMAFWGEAMALGPYINMDMDPADMKGSCAAVDAGLRSDPASSERAWLEAAKARCSDFGDPALYIGAARALATRLPDDPDAQMMLAEALLLPSRWRWYEAGKPAEGVAEAEGILAAVMRRFPEHPGANHLYVHAVESSPTPERAIAASQRLMGIVPSTGHMVHMPGHIWLALGDFKAAIAVNERAVEVDRQFFARTGVNSSYGMYYLHNIQFLLHSHAMLGSASGVSAAVREMREAIAPMAATMAEMTEVFALFIDMAQARMLCWDEILRAEQPKANPVAAAVSHHFRGLAFAAKGDRSASGRERAEFEKLRKTVDRNAPCDTNKTGDVLDLASVILEARLAESPAQALPIWKKAVEVQDRLAYDERPAWYYPVRESLGAALMLSDDAAGAESVFREGVRRSPNNGRMLFGLLESLKAQGKDEAAAWVEREFKAAWKDADVVLRIADL